MGDGNCFEAAVRLQNRHARDGRELLVVQAMMEMAPGLRDWHSWCEAEGMVYDNSNSARLDNGGTYRPGRGVAGGVRGGKMLVEPIADYYARRHVDSVRRYTRQEVAQHMIRTGFYEVWEPIVTPTVTQTVTRRRPDETGNRL